MPQYVESLAEALIVKLKKRGGPIEAKGRLECHLAPMMGLGSNTAGYAMAASLLEKMETEGRIEIVRSGSSMRAVMLPSSEEEGEGEVDASIETAQANNEQESKAVDTPEPSVKAIKRDRLNALLRVLRAVAEPDGTLKGVFIPLAAREMNVTENTVRDLSAVLGRLELRLLTGPRKSPVYQIDMTDKEVTIQMLDELEAASATPSDAIPEQADKPVLEPANPPAQEQNGNEEPVAEPEGEAEVVSSAVSQKENSEVAASRKKSPIEQMADIVIELQAQNEAWEKKYNKAGVEANKVIAGLRTELQTARDEIGRLTAQQREAEQLSPRVLEILQQHASKDD